MPRPIKYLQPPLEEQKLWVFSPDVNKKNIISVFSGPNKWQRSDWDHLGQSKSSWDPSKIYIGTPTVRLFPKSVSGLIWICMGSIDNPQIWGPFIEGPKTNRKEEPIFSVHIASNQIKEVKI